MARDGAGQNGICASRSIAPLRTGGTGSNMATTEVLHPRKLKWTLVLLASAGFVAIGLAMMRDPDVQPRFMVYLTIGFFGLCGLAALLQLIPGSSYLRLTPDGLTMRTMWRDTTYRWSDIERFGVGQFATIHGPFRQKHRMIGIDFVPGYPLGGVARQLTRVSSGISGFQGALPDNYGRDYEELAAYLNQLKARYTSPAEEKR